MRAIVYLKPKPLTIIVRVWTRKNDIYIYIYSLPTLLHTPLPMGSIPSTASAVKLHNARFKPDFKPLGGSEAIFTTPFIYRERRTDNSGKKEIRKEKATSE
jgi:hypothetical protein